MTNRKENNVIIAATAAMVLAVTAVAHAAPTAPEPVTAIAVNETNAGIAAYATTTGGRDTVLGESKATTTEYIYPRDSTPGDLFTVVAGDDSVPVGCTVMYKGRQVASSDGMGSVTCEIPAGVPER